jgi:hypothetical protein
MMARKIVNIEPHSPNTGFAAAAMHNLLPRQQFLQYLIRQQPIGLVL